VAAEKKANYRNNKWSAVPHILLESVLKRQYFGAVQLTARFGALEIVPLATGDHITSYKDTGRTFVILAMYKAGDSTHLQLVVRDISNKTDKTLIVPLDQVVTITSRNKFVNNINNNNSSDNDDWSPGESQLCYEHLKQQQHDNLRKSPRKTSLSTSVPSSHSSSHTSTSSHTSSHPPTHSPSHAHTSHTQSDSVSHHISPEVQHLVQLATDIINSANTQAKLQTEQNHTQREQIQLLREAITAFTAAHQAILEVVRILTPKQ
jgi:hypothetical protein